MRLEAAARSSRKGGGGKKKKERKKPLLFPLLLVTSFFPMESSSNSSSSSCASFSSLEDVSVKGRTSNAVKFLCSYGGKILPRYPEGKLRYIGGETRVLTVDRSIPYSELQAKMRELCGWDSFSLRCQLPTEDLDALVSITSDEDLAHVVEEYDVANRDRLVPLKIRAFLYPSKSSPSSTKGKASECVSSTLNRGSCVNRAAYVPSRLSGRSVCVFNGPGKPRHQFLVHHGNQFQ